MPKWVIGVIGVFCFVLAIYVADRIAGALGLRKGSGPYGIVSILCLVVLLIVPFSLYRQHELAREEEFQKMRQHRDVEVVPYAVSLLGMKKIGNSYERVLEKHVQVSDIISALGEPDERLERENGEGEVLRYVAADGSVAKVDGRPVHAKELLAAFSSDGMQSIQAITLRAVGRRHVNTVIATREMFETFDYNCETFTSDGRDVIDCSHCAVKCSEEALAPGVPILKKK